MNDAQFMHQALELAKRAMTTTTPNPRVGCVIVKNERVIAEGYHERAGGAHAEVAALRAAGAEAAGASVYVTLEPCAHQGRTGPCCDALIQADVKEVVYAMVDPNPLVAGLGLSKLRAAGIAVRGPVHEPEARSLNPGFIKRMTTGLPWVRLKIAMSLDGRTAMASGESKWITGVESRLDVQEWRARSCAIVTGVATVLADDPELSVRAPQFGDYPRQPLRVVLDSALKTPADARIFKGGKVTIASCTSDTDTRYTAPIWHIPGADGRVDLHELLVRLGAEPCNEILIEAGPTLAGAFVEAGLVDELVVYIAPKLLGSAARPMLHLPLTQLKDARGFTLRDSRPIGPDLRLILSVGEP